MYELKENSVTIFKNEKKSETHPDYKGQINVNGKLFDIALWVKDGKKGKFFSGKISEPYKAEPPAGIYEKTGKLDKPFDKEQIQDDTPVDSDGLPF